MQRLEFTLDDSTQEVQFTVTQSSEWLVLKFDWEKQMTWGEMRVIDPAGQIRFTFMDVHGKRSAVIHRDQKFNSYTAIPGNIEEGEWTICFIREVPRRFTLDWEYGDGMLPGEWIDSHGERNDWTTGYTASKQLLLDAYDWQQCLEQQARWYKGDCHGHTVLSDGKMTPEQTMEQAKKMGLDFFFVTEHNVLPSSWPQGSILVIPGMEFTSFGRGDWNALGMRAWIDCWGVGHDGGMSTDEGQLRLLSEAREQGAIRVINHPMSSRFSWRYPDTPISSMDVLEIWNSPAAMNKTLTNDRALKIWTALWNEGYRIPGIGGSDTHGFPDEQAKFADKPQTIGDPATFIYAEELSPSAILAGIRAGHAYVSRGPEIQVQYRIEGAREFTFGDDLTEAIDDSADGKVHCALTVSAAKDCILRCVSNGIEITAERITDDCQRFEFQFDWNAHPYVWSRFEIRTETEQLLAVSNPVSYGSKQPSAKTWRDILACAGLTLPVTST